jgi:Tol biopolymer transport system component
MWTPDGSGLVFASLRTGTPSLWLQRVRDGRADGNPELLDKNMGAFRPITLTHRGSLFYTHRTGSFDVYTVPIDSVTGDIRGEPKIAASKVQGSNLAADWSPDGSTVVFTSWRTLFGPGRNILVFHPFNGGPERELALDVDVVNSPRWSPDGRLIAVGGADRQGVRALRLIDAESGRIVSTHFPLPGDVPPVGSGVWAPDGKHMYLKRQAKVWRFEPQSGEMVALYPQPPGSFLGILAISPDGRSLAFNLNMSQEKVSRLVVIPATGGAPRELVKAADPVRLNLGGWTRDGKQLLFVRISATEGQQNGEIWAVPSEGSAPRSLGLTMPSLRDLRVSPDGSRVSFTSGYPDQKMWVFENFLPQVP